MSSLLSRVLRTPVTLRSSRLRGVALAVGLTFAAAGGAADVAAESEPAASAAVRTAAAVGSILFIGNSFTYADRSPVQFWHADTVTDLNGLGIGGMPALFKSFATQTGLDYDVFVETEPGAGLDWHLAHRADTLGQRPWDNVVMHGFSTLDAKKPGDPALLVDTVARMSALLREHNPDVAIHVMATWPRADQVYKPRGTWFGKGVDAMADDLQAGYEQATAATPGLKPAVPVGEAWARAMRTGVADADPYDGIEAGKVDLWSWDHYHASTFGVYLEALVVFGSVTGVDPRTLGADECSAVELGLSPAQVTALEQVAYDQLAAAGAIKAGTPAASRPGRTRCGAR